MNILEKTVGVAAGGRRGSRFDRLFIVSDGTHRRAGASDLAQFQRILVREKPKAAVIVSAPALAFRYALRH